MPFALLLAMQAAGMVFDYLGTRQQQMFGEYGAKIQQAGIDANIEQTRLETEDASLQALQMLRKNMGTQLAVFAARGTNPGAGSALLTMNEDVSNFNADERMRRMNLLANVNNLKAGKVMSQLNQSAEKSKLWQGFAQRSFNTIGTTALLGGGGGGGTSTAAKYGAMARGSRSYGLTQMAGS